jgi:hypothetical protein
MGRRERGRGDAGGPQHNLLDMPGYFSYPVLTRRQVIKIRRRVVKMDEKQMIAKAKVYLKSHYGEDTVSMDVTGNSVAETGSGVLSVDCTVSVGGEHSDWSKKFHFRNGEITRMDWKSR